VTLHTGDGTNSATDLYWGSKRPIWNNDGDTASLYDHNGRLVDSLERQGWAWWATDGYTAPLGPGRGGLHRTGSTGSRMRSSVNR